MSAVTVSPVGLGAVNSSSPDEAEPREPPESARGRTGQRAPARVAASNGAPANCSASPEHIDSVLDTEPSGLFTASSIVTSELDDHDELPAGLLLLSSSICHIC